MNDYAKTAYVDNNAGDDENDGTSEQTPKQSMAAAIAAPAASTPFVPKGGFTYDTRSSFHDDGNLTAAITLIVRGTDQDTN